MKILVVSNMYPNIKNPYYGAFVKNFCDNLDQIGINYEKSVMVKQKSKSFRLVGYTHFYFKTFLKIVINKYDVIYVHFASHSAPPVLLANKIKNVTVYTNVHGSDVIVNGKSQSILQSFSRKLLGLSSKIIVPSDYFKDYVSNTFSISNDKIIVYPSGGINPQIFYRYNETKIVDLKQKYNFDLSSKYIGYVSRLIDKKGWRTFVLAAKELVGINPKLKFVIVGSGPSKVNLIELINQLNIEDYFTIFDMLPQQKLADIYNLIDIFVFPTEMRESLGLVALEAMACGTPVFASNIAAPKYYIIDGYNGYKFPVGDYKYLAEKIKSYFDEDSTHIKQGALDTAEIYKSNNIRNILEKLFKNPD